MQNNYNRRKPEKVAVRYSCFQIGCVIVEYDLFNATTFIQNLTYSQVLSYTPFIFPLQSL